MPFALPAGLGVLLVAATWGVIRGSEIRALALVLASMICCFLASTLIWSGGGTLNGVLIALAAALFILAVAVAIEAALRRRQRRHAVEEHQPR